MKQGAVGSDRESPSTERSSRYRRKFTWRQTRQGAFNEVRKKAMARLLSVNVGLPRDVAWQGKTVHTAIWKAPVKGPRMVRRLNIDGDGQADLAGHGGE